ncbi:plasmid maintenance system antidote protein VapI [Natronocella acetinitrilica]|uniref:Plasmid maintenance system antidote protein VapI n=1 Tax=Natronocella acetinitrilica TaxID=414046 RepID=A0AAE3KFN6_9GAMM|nr:hypothetical protein [Natronocella acetinitrilica]MCP1674257.1 plasmid maintenance system antidote protein VapI [Natronocella acetinitrilica]
MTTNRVSVVALRDRLKQQAAEALTDFSTQLRTMKQQVQKTSDTRLAELIGVRHPTVGRILDASRPGASGVAIKSWLAAWHRAGMLEPAMKGYYRRLHAWSKTPKVQAAIEQAGQRPERVHEMIVQMAASEQEKDRDSAVASALLQLALGAELYLEYARRDPINHSQLAEILGITPPTAKRLTSPIDDSGQGTKVETYLMLWALMGTLPEMAKALQAALDQALGNPKKARAELGADFEKGDEPVQENTLDAKPRFAMAPRL